MRLKLREKERMPKMGNSDSKVHYEGSTFIGKHNKYKLLKEIGSGGNGKVFDVEIVGNPQYIPASRDGYVIKVLTQSDNDKRIERFIREIQTVIKHQTHVNGMIPIYDYFLDESNNLYWFLMPKARKYIYFRNSAYDNLKQMLDLGQILSELHTLNCAHRDVKPENILLYDNRIYLSDYGLIWDADVSLAITGSDEHLGPFIIRPPEFEKYAYREDNIQMYRASDVYLFAKTLWMVISRKDHGFFGEYSRNDTSKCLDRGELSLGITIEPLHRLMEGATKDDYQERISLEDCLNLIRVQMQIKEMTISKYELGQLAFSERITAATNTTLPDEVTYTEMESLLNVINAFSNVADVVIDNVVHSINLGKLSDARIYNDNVIVLDIRDTFRKKQLYVSIENLKINRKNGSCSCTLKPTLGITDPSIQKITEINEIELITVKKATLDVSVKLNLSSPTA